MPKICVVGDIILDRYDFVTNRINPESSGPCYTIADTTYKPGGAGNVAANLVALGSTVKLVGVVGEDHHRTELSTLLKSRDVDAVLIADKARPTIVKQRIISSHDGRYHCRIDSERPAPLHDDHTQQIINAALNGYDCYLISDYAKGVVSQRLVQELIATGKPVIIDPKPAHMDYYKNASFITPNIKEVLSMSGGTDDLKAAQAVAGMLSTHVLLTRSEQGIAFVNEQGTSFVIPADAQEITDVTGAGDTVAATFAHYLATGKTVKESATLANKAAGIAVGHIGCYQVTRKELEGR